jgi:hypothetical protein
MLTKSLKRETLQVSVVGSLPAVQWSGDEGWQRWRIATGFIWTF